MHVQRIQNEMKKKKRSVQAVEINLGKKSFIMHKPSSRLHDCYIYYFS